MGQERARCRVAPPRARVRACARAPPRAHAAAVVRRASACRAVTSARPASPPPRHGLVMGGQHSRLEAGRSRTKSTVSCVRHQRGRATIVWEAARVKRVICWEGQRAREECVDDAREIGSIRVSVRLGARENDDSFLPGREGGAELDKSLLPRLLPLLASFRSFNQSNNHGDLHGRRTSLRG